MSKGKYLLDVNVLVALFDEEHVHHNKVVAWFDSTGKDDCGVCAFSEAGFLRVSSNPKAGGHSLKSATDVLKHLALQPGYCFWPITESWVTLSAPFSSRLFGHRQVTDCYLLGLAVSNNGILVTLDKAIESLARELSQHVLVL